MASQLSDAELRKKLKELGEDVGPITTTTRQLWVKRLDKLLEKKRDSPRTLNALSSDDSDVDATSNLDSSRIFRKKKNNLRYSSPVVHLNRINLSKYLSPQPADPDFSLFKKPVPICSRTVGTKGPTISDANNSVSNFYNSKLNKRNLRGQTGDSPDFETSDSEIDSETVSTPSRSTRPRYVNSYHKPSCDKENSRELRRSHLSPLNDNSYNAYSEKGINTLYPNRKLCQTPVICNRSEKLSFKESPLSKGDCSKASANGYLTDDTVLNGEFRNGKAAGKTTNYSHYISWMLVLCVASFFVIIGMVYMSEVQKVSQATATSSYIYLTCGKSNQIKCIPQEHLSPSLTLCRGLHDLLAATAGEYECQNERKGSRNVSISSVKRFIKEKIRERDIKVELDEILKYIVLLIAENPEWNLKVHLEDEEHGNSAGNPIELRNISALESVVAAKSFWCRVQHSVRWTATELFACVLVVVFLILISYVVKYWKQRKELQEKQMYELVEKIISILQKPEDTSQPGSNSLPCKAVVHVRDMLIAPKERKSKQWLWDKTVTFIEENESRVRVEYRHIAGESFKVWKWLPNSTPESDAGRQGKVWQGQAFGSVGKGKYTVPFGATPCLKIRNMFDPEVEYGDDWQICIQDAILEKCEGNNGIVHIAVDTTSSEGCVYLMCNSSNTAGQAFNALHGWWFDGKLVTVKYLRLERYLERFPSARHCVEPLSPSNNKRLSLSAPFFSSELERS